MGSLGAKVICAFSAPFVLIAIWLSTTLSSAAIADVARFEFDGIPQGASIFVDGVDKTAPYSSLINGGVLRIHADIPPDAAPDASYTTDFKVTATSASGESLIWEVNVSYKAGDSLRFLVNLKPKNGTEAPPEQVPSERAHLNLTVQPETFLYINGKRTLLEGSERDFLTPPIQSGQAYSTVVKFDFRNKSGRRIIRTKKFTVHGGETLAFKNPETIRETMAGVRGQPAIPRYGHLRLVVTLDTILTINGQLTKEEGEVRDFTTPPLVRGQTFVAKVQFDFTNKTGRHIVQQRNFLVHADETVNFPENPEGIEQLSEGEAQ